MGNLYLVLALIFYILSRQWNVLCHELGHVLFILKFTKNTDVTIVIGTLNKDNLIYRNRRLKIYYKFFFNFWKGGYCVFDDREKFSLNEYLLIVLGGPLASLTMAIVYGILFIVLNNLNDIISMLLCILCITASIDFFWNILPIKLTNKSSNGSLVINNDGYLIKQLLHEKFILHGSPNTKKWINKLNFNLSDRLLYEIINSFKFIKKENNQANIPKYSYNDFIPYFGKDRFDKGLIHFIKRFGNYKLSSQLYPNDIAYFEEMNIFTDNYLNEANGFELLFADIGFSNNLTGKYPEKLILVEIIFYAESLNEKSHSNGLLGTIDTTTLFNNTFPDLTFKGALPGNIFINEHKVNVIRKLGEPLTSDRINNFDIFISEDNKLTFKVFYNISNSIKYIIISPVKSQFEDFGFTVVKD